jgi:dTDP-4-dehydrorhamnose reductase
MDTFLLLGGKSHLASCFSSLYPNITKSKGKADCDITNIKQVEKTLKRTEAKYILNCVAITDIEYCENNPLECFKTNTIAVLNLEKACTKFNKKLIHISSDYAVYPVNTYGLSKYLCEKILDLKKTLIIRTCFYSRDTFLVKELLGKRKVIAYKNMYFNPVSINRVAESIYKNRNKKGILNVFSSKRISKYSFAKKVCKIFGIDSNLVKESEFENKPGFAQRSYNSYVASDMAITLEDGLEDFKNML